jgi:hypothetical protein
MITNGFKQPILETPVKAWIVLVVGVLAGLVFAAATYVIQLQVKQVGERISWWGVVAGREVDGINVMGSRLTLDGIHAWQTTFSGYVQQPSGFHVHVIEAVWGRLENGTVAKPLLRVSIPSGLGKEGSPGWQSQCAGELCALVRYGLIYNATSGASWNLSQLYGGTAILAWERQEDGSVLAAVTTAMSYREFPWWPYYSKNQTRLFRLYPDGSWREEKVIYRWGSQPTYTWQPTTRKYAPFPPSFYYTVLEEGREGIAYHPGGFISCTVKGCEIYQLGNGFYYPVGKAWDWYFVYDDGSKELLAVKPGLLGSAWVRAAPLGTQPVAVYEAGLNLGALTLSKVAILQLMNGSVMVVEASKLDALLFPKLSIKKAGQTGIPTAELSLWDWWLHVYNYPAPVQARTPVYLLYWTGVPPTAVRVIYVTEDLIALLLYIAAGVLLALGQPLAAAGAAAAATGIVAKGALLGYSIRFTLAWPEIKLKYSVETILVDVQVNPIPFLPSRALFLVEHAQAIPPGYDTFYLVDGILPPDLILLLLVLALAATLTGAWVGAYIVLKRRRKREGGERGGMLEVLVKLRNLG